MLFFIIRNIFQGPKIQFLSRDLVGFGPGRLGPRDIISGKLMFECYFSLFVLLSSGLPPFLARDLFFILGLGGSGPLGFTGPKHCVIN